MSQYNSNQKKIQKSTITNHRQYPKCRRRLRFWIGGGVEKTKAVEMGCEGSGSCAPDEELPLRICKIIVHHRYPLLYGLYLLRSLFHCS